MTLCLIAGQGRLPSLLLGSLEAAGRPPLLAQLEGFPMEGHGARPVITFRIERLGSFLADLTARGVTRVCFAGAIRRPPLEPALVDGATMPLVPRMTQALAQGDDAALRAVLGFFEQAGLRIVAAHQVLPDLLLPAGIPTRVRPDAAARRDAARGAAIVAALGAADVGQACVVAAGQALAVEAMPGTDRMLAGVAWLRDGTHPASCPDLPPGGLLCKAPKPGQDRRIDLPAIGPETVRGAAAAGLAGIVIEAGGVLVLDAAATLALADRLGLFLWVRAAE